MAETYTAERQVLLLGGPSSGKSTIIKQMRILHLNGFTESDYVNYRDIIRSNAVMGLEMILEAAKSLHFALPQTLRDEATK
jgi:nicotinamide riboside kinase